MSCTYCQAFIVGKLTLAIVVDCNINVQYCGIIKIHGRQLSRIVDVFKDSWGYIFVDFIVHVYTSKKDCVL